MRVHAPSRSMFALLLFVLIGLVAPAALAQPSQQHNSCRGNGASGNFEIGIVVDTPGDFAVSMTDMTTGIVLQYSDRTINTSTVTMDDCHYRAYAYCGGGEDQDPDANPIVYQNDRLYRLDIASADPTAGYPAASFYTYFIDICPPGSSVFCPQQKLGYDTVFFITGDRVLTYPESLGPYGGGTPVEVYFPDNHWVLPYDWPTICNVRGCPSPLPGSMGNSTFFSPAPLPGAGPNTLPVTLTASTGADWRIPNGRTVNWSSSDVSAIQFGVGGRLTVNGTLNVGGVAVTAAVPASGWGGVTVPSGGQLSLGAGSTVERVAATASRPGAVVVTAGGRATLDGATVQQTTGAGFGGLYATGTNAAIRITGDSQIRNNESGPGVRAAAGASVTVDGDGVQIYNNAEGVVASGANARALVLAGTVRNNLGSGVRASSGGRVDVLRSAGGGGGSPSASVVLTNPVTLSLNSGGLYATPLGKQGGGVVSTGDYVCVQPPCQSIGGHTFFENTQPRPGGGPVYDAEALGGSQVIATHNYWDGRTAAQVAAASHVDGKSVLLLSPTLLTPPGGSSAGRSASGGLSSSSTFARGRVSTGVQTLLAEADARVQAGDSVLAGARIIEAYGIVTGDDDREAVAEAAGRALVVVQPPALVAWAEDLTSGPDHPWGRRALALAHAGAGRYVEAAVVAQALADEDGAGADSASVAHRARGLGLVVAFAVASGDEAGALAALSSLASVDADGAADAAVEVAVAFPDADVTLVRQAATVRGTAPVVAEGANLTAGVEAVVGLTVGPNPTAGRVAVEVALPAASVATVAVFDARGREVAVLHDGAAPSEVLNVSFDAGSLPAGVYVVRAVVRTPDGASSVLARRLVVAR